MSDIDKPQEELITEPQGDSPQNTDEQFVDEGPDSPVLDAPVPEDAMPSEPEPTKEQIRGERFISGLKSACDEEDVHVAFAIVLDKQSEQPIMYSKGSTYQVTRVLADVTKYFKGMLMKELDT